MLLGDLGSFAFEGLDELLEVVVLLNEGFLVLVAIGSVFLD